MADAASAFAFLRQRFGRLAGDILLCALPEPRDAPRAGRAREYRLKRPVDPELVAKIVERETRPNRGLFFCVGTLKPDAVKTAAGAWRAKSNILMLPGVHADIDFKHLDLPAGIANPTAEVTRLIGKSPWAPRPLALSGGGMHGYWTTLEPLKADDFDQAEAVMRALARHFGGDPAVAEVARLMRLPGSINWKYGEPRPVVVSQSGIATIDIWDEEIGAGKPIIDRALESAHRTSIAGNVSNAYEAYAAQHQAPIDVEQRLAGMIWHGAGESGVHQTQLQVTASMLVAGIPRDEVIREVLDATLRKPFAQGWNAQTEQRAITAMVDSFIAKMEIEQPIRLNGGNSTAAAQALPPTKQTRFGLLQPVPYQGRATMPRREFLYGKHYVRGFMSVTIGASGVGKSNLAIAEALAMVIQRDLLGHMSSEPLRVWYHNAEDPIDELNRRLCGAIKRYEVTEEEFGQRLFISSGREFKLIVAEPGLRSHQLALRADAVDFIKRTIAERHIDVLIIDPLVAVHRLDENSNVQMNEVAEIFVNIAEECGCAIDLIQHSRKTNGEEVTIEHARGASALVAAARSARVLNTMTENEAEMFGIDPSERRRYFRIDNGKASLHHSLVQADWNEMASITLDNGPGGLDGDYVGVVKPWLPPGAFRNVGQAQIDKALEVVRGGQENGLMWRREETSPDWVGYGIGPALGINPEQPEGKHQLKQIIAHWLTNNLLKVVRGPDHRRQQRPCVTLGAAAVPR